MGKNYIESSLKRFLKRKVKITLGVVVSFLITGMVAFAAEKSETVVKLEEQQGNYTITKDNLTGLGAKIFENEMKDDNTHSVELTKSNDSSKKINISITRTSGKTTIKTETIRGTERKFSFDDKFVSEKVKINIENALKNNYTIVNTGVVINENGITNFGQYASTKTDGTLVNKVTNNGILFNVQGTGISNSTLINNGVIYSAEKIQNGGQALGQGDDGGVCENVKMYNNGLIISNYAGQDNFTGIKTIMVNRGTISSEKYGQTARKNSEENRIYNYGIIQAKNGGQYIVSS